MSFFLTSREKISLYIFFGFSMQPNHFSFSFSLRVIFFRLRDLSTSNTLCFLRLCFSSSICLATYASICATHTCHSLVAPTLCLYSLHPRSTIFFSSIQLLSTIYSNEIFLLYNQQEKLLNMYYTNFIAF